MQNYSCTANQAPHEANYMSRAFRTFMSILPAAGLYTPKPSRPQGISIYMRVKDERDWIGVSIDSIKSIADEIIVVDNGSTDGTWEILQGMAAANDGRLKLWQRPDLRHGDLSNFALEQTSFRWVFRWDGDMVAHTDGPYAIDKLRARLFRLNSRRYYLIYLRHINLSGDLFHQDPKEMVHIEEYIHTFSKEAYFIHPGRFEAVKFPLYYKPLFWYEPFAFHVNIKPARRMLMRYFWEDWMELKDYSRYPKLEDFVEANIEQAFGTSIIEEAQQRCITQLLANHIPYCAEHFGPYPKLLQPLLATPAYRLRYENGQIAGREES